MSELKVQPPEEKKQIDIGLDGEHLRPNERGPPRCRPEGRGGRRASKPKILHKMRSVCGAQEWPSSVWFGDYAAGYAGGGAAAGGYGVDDDGGAAVAENGVIIGAERNVGRDRGDLGSAVRGNNQGKIRNVSSRMTAVGVVFGVEVRARGFEIGWIAFRILMDVNGMFSGRKIFDVQRDFDAGGSGSQKSAAHALAPSIDQIHGDGFAGGMGMGILRKRNGGSEQEYGGADESLHLFRFSS